MRLDRNMDTLFLFAAEAQGTGKGENGTLPTTQPDNTFTNPGGDKNLSDAGEFEEWGYKVPKSLEELKAEKAEKIEAAPDPALEHVEPGTAGEEEAPETVESAPAEEKAEDRPAEAAAPETPEVEASASSDIQKILEKYKTPGEVAKGYLNIQKLATAKGEQLKEAQAKLDQLQQIKEQYFDQAEDGSVVLRPEKAREAMSSTAPPAPPVNEQAIYQGVLQEAQADLKKLGVEEEDMPRAMENWQDKIRQTYQDRVQSARQNVVLQRQASAQRALEKSGKFFRENKDYEKVIDRIDKWYERFPQEVRHQLILNDWLPLKEVAEIEHTRANFEAAVKEAYEKGRDSAAKGVLAPESAGGSVGSGNSKASPDIQAQYDDDIKAGIMNLGSLESIFD